MYDIYIVCTEEIDKNMYNLDLDNITILRIYI